MAVIDPRTQGGILPQFKRDDVEAPAGKRRSAKDRFDDAYAEGLELRGYKLGAGIEGDADVPGGKQATSISPKVEETLLVNTIKSKDDLLATLLAKLLPTAGQSESPMIKLLTDELKEMRSALQNTGDPVDTLFRYQQQMGQFAEQLKQQLGLPASVQPKGAEDLSSMLAIKKMDIESQDRWKQWEFDQKEKDRKYEEEKLEKQRRWTIEDRHWEMEFKLKLKEAETAGAEREDIKGQLMDLGKGLFGNIDRQMAGGRPAPSTAARPETVAQPAAQTVPVCTNCGGPLRLETPDLAKCQTCGAEYVKCQCGMALPIARGAKLAKCGRCQSVYDFTFKPPDEGAKQGQQPGGVPVDNGPSIGGDEYEEEGGEDAVAPTMSGAVR